MRNKHLLILILALLLLSCTKDCLEQSVALQEPTEWITAKVAVVLPLSGDDSDKMYYERISKMFEENITKAQFDFAEGVKLELEWYDENTLDIRNFANDLYYRDDIVALIGPLRDENVDVVANVIYKREIAMFVMTSSEDLVRRYSPGTAGVLVKRPFMWSLSDIDIVQSQIIIAKAATMGVKRLSLVCADTDYGNTFDKWVPYYARKMGVKMVDEVQYSDVQHLEDEFCRVCESDAEIVVCAIESPDDARVILEIAKNHPSAPKIYFTGSALNSALLKLGPLAEGAEGFSMYASPATGFYQAYQVRFGELPMYIEAQLYDALLLSLISFAYCHYSGGDISMNEALAALSDLPLTNEQGQSEALFWETGTPVWGYAALGEIVLKPAQEGRFPDLNLMGAIGNIKFASKAYTALAKSTYINWRIYDGSFVALDFIDEESYKYSSYIDAWTWLTIFEELENDQDSQYDIKMPEGNKAVLICGSEGWYNYRHQADILYVYNTLKDNHYSDDDIILIMRDDIAFHPKNPHQGVIRVSPDGENLYHDVVIDYRADTLSTKDIENILLGNKSERLTTVLESTNTDNVLLYWTGHGTNKSFSWLKKGERFTDEQLGNTVRQMYAEKRYQSMLIVTEPCYSGSVVKAIEGTPLVLGFSAASDNESSYADNYNNALGVWMCDRFTYNLICIYEEWSHIDLLDTYKKLNTTTLGSHVQVYNVDYFYNLSESTLYDYFNNYNH